MDTILYFSITVVCVVVFLMSVRNKDDNNELLNQKDNIVFRGWACFLVVLGHSWFGEQTSDAFGYYFSLFRSTGYLMVTYFF